jgi:hypothetical protein
MVRRLVRVVGIGTETADMLVREAGGSVSNDIWN